MQRCNHLHAFSFWLKNNRHVYRHRTQSQVAAGYPAARELSRERQGQEPYTANLSMLPRPAIEALRLSLKGQRLAPLNPESLQITDSLQHGPVQAVLDAMKRLKIAQLIDARPSPERDRVVTLIAARVIEPHTKLATVRWWHTTTLPLLFCDEDQHAKTTRDPVAPATRSTTALDKVYTHTLDDGSPAHSYRTLMKSLATITRNTCCITTADEPATFDVFTTPTTGQQRAFDLLKYITL